MSRRQYNVSPRRFHDERANYKQNTRRHPRDDVQRFKDYHDGSDRYNSEKRLDRHGQYHQAVLKEDFVSPEDENTDLYDYRRYDDRDYLDRRSAAHHGDDTDLDRFGDDYFSEDIYVTDNQDYDRRNDISDFDSFSRDKRYDDQFDNQDQSDYPDYLYERHSVEDRSPAFYDDKQEAGSDHATRTAYRINDNERHHAFSGGRSVSKDRDGRMGRNSRDSNRRYDGKTHKKDREGASQRFHETDQVVGSSKSQKRSNEEGFHDRKESQVTEREHESVHWKRHKDDRNSPTRHEGSWLENKDKKSGSRSSSKHHQSRNDLYRTDSPRSSLSRSTGRRSSIERKEKKGYSLDKTYDNKAFDSKDREIRDVLHTDRRKDSHADTQRKHGSGDNLDKVSTASFKDNASWSGVGRNSFEGIGDSNLSRQKNTGRDIESFDVYHDDDVLSILADDDRFDKETRGLLRTDSEKKDDGKSEGRQHGSKGCQRFSDRYSIRSDKSNQNKQIDNRPRAKHKDIFRQKRIGFYKRNIPLNITGRSSFNAFSKNRMRGSKYSSMGKRSPKDLTSKKLSVKKTNNASNRQQLGKVRQGGHSTRNWSNDKFGKKTSFSRAGKSLGHSRNNHKNTESRVKDDRKLRGSSLNSSSGKRYTEKRSRNDTFEDNDKFSKNGGDLMNSYDDNDRDYEFNENIQYSRDDRSRSGDEVVIDDIGGNVERNTHLPETGQQIIFIPNSTDFQNNVDLYGNIVDTGNVEHQGSLQQVPYPLLPTNIPHENPQRSDQLIFIPFVNNQLQPDKAVPVQLDGEGRMQSQEIEHSIGDTKAGKSNNKTKKGLTVEQRAKIRKQLLVKRRQRLEKEIEQKVLKKLLSKTDKTHLQSNPKTKKGIKRLSPPKKSGAMKVAGKKQTPVLEDVSDDDDDDDDDKYDDVSDLESISDDEENFTRKKGSQRKAFRKPGEPRINQMLTSESSPDVRRVVEKNQIRQQRGGISYKNYGRGRKRTVHEVTDEENLVTIKKPIGNQLQKGNMSHKLDSKANRSMSPLQITVSNDKFSDSQTRNREKYFSDEENEGQDCWYDMQTRAGNAKGTGRGNRRGMVVDDYGDAESGRDMSDIPRRKYVVRTQESNHGSNNYQQQNRSRMPSLFDYNHKRPIPNNQEGYQNSSQWSGNQGERYISHSQTQVNEKAGLQQSPFLTQGMMQQNQSLLPAQTPFQAPTLKSQVQHLPGQVQSNISLVNTGSSVDPSLPPVLSTPQLSQPNLLLRPDMSLPPPQVSLMGNQPSLSQMTYQPALQSQSVLSLQNQVLQSNQQFQQATIQQQQQQLLQLQQQALLNNTNQLNSSAGASQNLFQTPVQQNVAGTLFQTPIQQTTGGPTALDVTNQQNSVPVGRVFQQQQHPQQQPNQQQNRLDQVNQRPIQNQEHQRTVMTTLQQKSNPPSRQTVNVSSAGNSAPMGQQTTNVRSASLTATRQGPIHQRGSTGVSLSKTGNTSILGSTQLSQTVQMKPVQGSYQRNDKHSGRGTGSQARSVGQESSGKGSISHRSRSSNEQTQVNRSPIQQGKYDNRSASSRPSSQGRKHGGNASRKGDSEGESDDDDDVGELLCTKCDKVYLLKTVMRKHVRWHDKSTSGQFNVRCDRCELAFSSPSALDDHIDERHTLNAWNCQFCDLTFPNSQALGRHLQKENHAGLSEKYICPTCCTQFGTLQKLIYHKQSHHMKHQSTRRY